MLAGNRCNLILVQGTVVKKGRMAHNLFQAPALLWCTNPNPSLHIIAPKKIMLACG